MEMLHAMAAAVKQHGADVGLGFDGDGDRCGVVDENGHEIFADKIGAMLARDLSGLHPNSTFVVDVEVDRHLPDRPGAEAERRQNPITGRPAIPTSSAGSRT